MRKVTKHVFFRALSKFSYVLLILVISLGIFAQPAVAQVSAEPQKSTISGVYDLLHDDFSDGTSKLTPFLYNSSSDISYELVASGAELPNKYVGSEITITGFVSKGKLTYNVADNTSLFDLSSQPQGVTSASTSPKTGTDTVGVFYVSFTDNRTRSLSSEQINDYAFRNYKDFLIRSSNGLYSVQGQVHMLDLDVNKNCDLVSINWGPLHEPGSLINDTKDAASNAGINIDSYKYKLIIIDPTIDCGKGGQAFRAFNFAYSVGLGAVAHELGHLYGLDHASAYDCPGTFIESSCEFASTEYWNYMDIMGSSNEHIDGDYGPFHKHKFGWLTEGSQVVDVNSNATYTLEKYEDIPGGQGPGYPTKVLRVRTYDGGPAYYISYRGKTNMPNGTRQGVTIELASGDLGGYKRTALLDTTPGTDIDRADFYDGYLHDGQQVTDPFNGIVFEGMGHNSSTASVKVSFIEPTATLSYLDVNFGMARGYLSALGRKQDVSWPAVNYVVSLKCTSNFLGCPADLGDKLTTVDNQGNLTLADGFSYEYSVDIYTKKDGDPNQTARYFWYKNNVNNVSCSGGATTCSINVSWPAVMYKTSLVKAGTTTKVCGGSSGCQDFIAVSAPTRDVSYRGLLNLSGDPDLEATVEIEDFGGDLHLLTKVTGLGKADDYSHSCSSNSAVTCTIGNTSGIGPFVGGEPILVAVKVGDQNGYVVSGPDVTYASANGSYTRNWSSGNGNTLWDYHVVAYPNEFSDCLQAGNECQVQSYFDTKQDSFRVVFAKARQNVDYRVIICAVTCNPGSGNSKIMDGVVRSANVTFGPSFFGSDPFDQTDGYAGEYFDSIDFTNKKFARKDTKIDFRWGSLAPSVNLAPDTFSVRWQRSVYFDNSTYRFITTADDGIRVYVDSALVIDAWNGPVLNQGVLQVQEGIRQVKIEYKENTGSATVKFGFAKAYSCSDLNGDNTINSIDLSIVAQHFGIRGLSPWDVNGDKNVNAIDLSQVAQKFGTRCL